MHFSKLNDRASRWFFAAAIVLNLAQWLTIALWPKAGLAPLHYTIYFGIDLTGPAWQLYGLAGFGTAIIFFHGLISVLQPSTLWSRLWAFGAVVNCLLLTAAMITLRVTSFR